MPRMSIARSPRGLRAPGNHSFMLPLRACGAVLLALLVSCHNPAGPQPESSRDVSITTSDGVVLAATLYAAPAGSPGLVLVHGLGSSRHAWDNFAQKARRAGFGVVSFDIRGHGQSVKQGGGEITHRTFTTEDWLGALADIDAARAFLVKQGADPENTVVIGASMGANLALHYAVKHRDVPAVVMISPGLDYKGVTTREKMAELGERPVLLMTSTGDSYSAASCSTLKPLAAGHCELREYAGTAHGTDLFDFAPSAVEQIFVWLEPIIGPEPKE